MPQTYRFSKGKTVMHMKETDDETYCGDDAGDTVARMVVSGLHQVGLVKGREVCESCRNAARDE